MRSSRERPGRPGASSPAPSAPAAATPGGPPAARVADGVEKVAGQLVHDPYRWMEGTDNAELEAWLTAQGRYAAAELAGIPARAALYEGLP